MPRAKTKTKGIQAPFIAGEWRLAPLPIPDVQGLRPTPDKVRETLFNWIKLFYSDFCAISFVALAH